MSSPQRGQRQPILVLELIKELGRNKLTLLLMVGCIGSAVAVVQVTHLSRQQLKEQDTLLQERDKLDTDWHYLLVEQGAYSEHSVIEQQAKDKLQMYRPSVNEEIVVSAQ